VISDCRKLKIRASSKVIKFVPNFTNIGPSFKEIERGGHTDSMAIS
jgi:hypothetical protein